MKRVERWEEKPQEITRPSGSISACIKSYLDDCRARNLAGSTITSYTKVLEHFENFCKSKTVLDAPAVDLDLFTDFRKSRKVKPSTQGKELEALRAFCRFWVNREWMTQNFAAKLKLPKEAAPFVVSMQRGLDRATAKLKFG